MGAAWSLSVKCPRSLGGGCARGGSEPRGGLSEAFRQQFLIPLCLSPLGLNRSELLELSEYAMLFCFCDFLIVQTAE